MCFEARIAAVRAAMVIGSRVRFGPACRRGRREDLVGRGRVRQAA
jgi:hypothetical protein